MTQRKREACKHEEGVRYAWNLRFFQHFILVPFNLVVLWTLNNLSLIKHTENWESFISTDLFIVCAIKCTHLSKQIRSTHLKKNIIWDVKFLFRSVHGMDMIAQWPKSVREKQGSVLKKEVESEGAERATGVKWRGALDPRVQQSGLLLWSEHSKVQFSSNAWTAAGWGLW